MEHDFTNDTPNIVVPPVAVYPIGPEGIETLERLYKWTNFYFIVSVVNLALGAVLQLVMVGIANTWGISQYDQSPIGTVMGQLIVSPLYIIPLVFIQRFKTNLQKSLDSNDPMILGTAFEFAKKYFKFQFLLMVIAIGAVMLIFTLTLLSVFLIQGAA